MFQVNCRKQQAEATLNLTLQRCNIRLSNYVSDIGCKSMRKVVKAFIGGETKAENLLPLIHRCIRNKHTDKTIIASLIAVISAADIEMMRMSMEEVELYERQIQECEEKCMPFARRISNRK
ncbi:MAG: hypothetical protein LBL90_08130 [Prevotellaceae bacterium]|jgi:hypothetical protein|nr:hypothetical protein [Prevotellaceae bacterium]